MVKILAVDDLIDMLNFYKISLGAFGYNVTTVDDGIKALEILDKEKFDLVITDLFMEPKPGIEVIVEMKKKYPDIKIIAISASVGNMNFLQLAKRMGATRILQKPVDSDLLVKTIKELLQ